ncbi:WG repeat-containing protein [Ruminiclostridium herbifermentans]|uniref:WG repeat-containing protein n=1 Tax=Ruminiclostridium herbifermentans TaxID=2488810 RepID=A0A4U7JDG2_9FIRM|nr:WG repeat-containing protein [Ruminiclostridium herbifermentans]QNU67640.1 WG repeat-containing protein [Ruminiclostridium herbifermentans]
MMKRLMSIMLILCMVMTLLPYSAIAADSNTSTAESTNTAENQNYYDSDVTWLGTTSDYQKTLNVFFDSGLRKVELNNKYGLVDKNGVFVVQPIYDSIEAYYLHKERSETKSTNQNKKNETIFVDGYVQATRNGKMGLLDSKGKEVIPCNYDAVGLPSEGICRISKKTNGKTYIGYWNLALGKEIVAPNKYVLPKGYEDLGDAEGGTIYGFIMPDIGENRIAVVFDFYGGYALVPTAKVVNVTEECTNNRDSRERTLVYAQIIDKNGKEVLKGGPYPFNINPASIRDYPQTGAYMVYDQLSTKRIRMKMDTGGEVIFKSHLESGIVGPKGIIVTAQYHGGIWGNSAVGWYAPGAQMKVIPELSLALTYKCGYEGIKESAARFGVIDFSNKIIIPFGSTEHLDYDSDSKVFVTEMGKAILKPNGTKISGTEKRSNYLIVNGYTILGEKGDDTGKLVFSPKKLLSLKTGKTYSIESIKGSVCTTVSVSDTLWVKKNNKWGLINVNGKTILPFEYEDIDTYSWEEKTKPYALVKKSGKWGMVDATGKVILACNYKSISWGEDGYYNIQDYATGKYGIFNFNTSKITTPCSLPGAINNKEFLEDGWGGIGGTVSINVGNSLNALFDMDTGKQVTSTYLVMKTSSRGLFYNTYNDIFGPDGRIVFNRAEDTINYTLVVKDGKVGSINVSRLKIGGKLPTSTYEKPKPEPINPRCYLVAYPENRMYLIGDGFDVKGLIVHYQDENGVRSIVDNSKLKFITSRTVELTQGRAFTTGGIKTVEVQYDGKKVDTFDINVLPKEAGDILKTGEYYIQILGKYIYPVNANGTLWLELSDKKPEKPFSVKLVNYIEDRGPAYTIHYDGRAIGQPSSKNGAQLQSAALSHTWRINKYTSFCTIRDYGNQKLLVNASGEKNANGTKVIVWSHTGSAPEHGKVKFIPAK